MLPHSCGASPLVLHSVLSDKAPERFSISSTWCKMHVDLLIDMLQVDVDGHTEVDKVLRF